MNWICIVIFYLGTGILVLVGACAYDNLSESNYLNTPTKRIIFYLFWGIIMAVFGLSVFPYILYKVIKEGL